MIDKRPILLATDGSPSAAEAERDAIQLAQLFDVALVVVSVVHIAASAVAFSGYGYSNAVTELAEAERHRIEGHLASVKENAEAAGVRCSTITIDGLAVVAVDGIGRVASEQDAQLIVVGSHGWGAGRRLVSGSVSTGLVHSAPCPVLVVRGRPHAEEQ